VLKMLSLCTHAQLQSLSPLADSRVNESLLHIIPVIPHHFNEELLQLVDVNYTTFRPTYKPLHHSSDLVVDGV